MGVYGLGHDVVDVASFGGQLAEPGSRMRALFSVREVRQAAARAALKNDGEAVHLAAKWAGKEAFLKAWCEALGEADYPFTLDDFPWSGVEILDDSRGVPHVTLSGKVAEAFRTSMEEALGDADGAHAGGPGASASVCGLLATVMVAVPPAVPQLLAVAMAAVAMAAAATVAVPPAGMPPVRI